MNKVLTALSVLLALALCACGSSSTKTVTVKAPDAAKVTQTTDTAAADAQVDAPAPKPTVDLSWDSPQQTTHDQVTLKGSVTKGAHVRVNGHRAAVSGTRWSKTVQIKQHGENTFAVTATKKGYDGSDAEASVTRRLSAAERAVVRQQKAERRANERALESAESYIEMSGMSKKGLYEQLSSSAGEGFTPAQAQYAVDHVHANWKQEAVQSAKSYLDMDPMSRNDLLQQLTSDAGEGFTYEQAVYAVDRVY